MHGGSRRRLGDFPRAIAARSRPDPSEGAYSAELSTGRRAWSDDIARASRIEGPRVTVVESAPSGESGLPQVARWIAAEAMSRGFQVRLERADQMTSQPRHPTDVALLMLHGLPPDSHQDEPTLPWERWSAAAGALTEQGAAVLVISSGAGAAAVAGCLRRGAMAVVDVDDAKRALDVVEDVARGTLNGDELQSILPCPYPRDQLQRLALLTPNETRVLFHLVCGHSAEHIANAQLTSLSTVRAHIRSIFRKLGVKSQIAAVAYANGTAATVPREDDEPEPSR
jgi:DNA-binding CsgD family transcriptional regulator